jgi:uncharacterized protein (TIGR02594 family)
MMHLTKIKKNTLFITSCAAIAFAAASFSTSAEARPHHRKARHHHVAVAPGNAADDRYAHVAQGGFFNPMQATMTQPTMQRTSRRAARQNARQTMAMGGSTGGMSFGGGSGLVSQARAYLGSNPTGKGSLWCARFLNMVLERSGKRGTGSDMASSFASYGSRVSGPQVGAIAVMSRGKRGGHVGIVSGIDEKGNPIIISGNHGGRVAESKYSRGRIYAYVMP